ncbi:MAG: TolC family protein [Deltaproteobacteria bacterium]
MSVLVAGLFALTRPVRAQTLGASLPTDATLSQLIRESLAGLPELTRSRAIVQAEEARISQAGALPDPMLQIGVQNDGFTSIEIGRMGTSFVSLMASQTFPWPGKLRLREELAGLGASQAKQALARVRLATEADVRRAYLELELVRDRLALLEQLDAIWQNSLGVARVRYETGDGAQSDMLRAQLERNRIKQRRFALQAEEQARVQAINRLRARPLAEPITTTTSIRELPALATFANRFSVERALRQSPELAAARLGVARADRSVALVERGYYPDLTVAAGIMLRGQLPPMWLATVGGPLPVFAASKQNRAAAENQAWAIAARADASGLEQVLALRTEERRTAFSALLQMVDLYDQGLLVQSQATTASTLSQYKVGRVPFASVLEANAGLIADQEGYLQAIAAAHRILITDAEVSLSPTPMPFGSFGPAASMPSAGASPMETTVGTPTSPSGVPPATGGSTSGM